MRRIIPLLLILPLLLLSNTSSAGQSSRCSVKLADLPAASELLGFHIGMTKEEVKARVPQVVFGKKNSFGVSKTTINPYFDPKIDKASFEGVRSISLDFLDDHLTSLWIGFDSSYKVPSVDEFVERISQSLHLPDAWTPWRTGQQMRCVDFQLTVTKVAGGPSFRLLDLGAEEVIATRREANEEEPEADTTSEAPDQILGDKQTKAYYPTGCKPPAEIAQADRVIFKTRDEADKAGFKVAPNCRQQ